jgi:hypothetical protein
MGNMGLVLEEKIFLILIASRAIGISLLLEIYGDISCLV